MFRITGAKCYKDHNRAGVVVNLFNDKPRHFGTQAEAQAYVTLSGPGLVGAHVEQAR